MNSVVSVSTTLDQLALGETFTVNALKKYNGLECSRRMLAMLDAGQLNRSEFRRIALLNKIPSSQINEFREAVG